MSDYNLGLGFRFGGMGLGGGDKTGGDKSREGEGKSREFAKNIRKMRDRLNIDKISEGEEEGREGEDSESKGDESREGEEEGREREDSENKGDESREGEGKGQYRAEGINNENIKRMIDDHSRDEVRPESKGKEEGREREDSESKGDESREGEGKGQYRAEGINNENIRGMIDDQRQDEVRPESKGEEEGREREDSESKGDESPEDSDSGQEGGDQADTGDSGSDVPQPSDSTQGSGQQTDGDNLRDAPDAQGASDVGDNPIDGDNVDLDAGEPDFSSQMPDSPDYGGSGCRPNAETMAGHDTSRPGQTVVTENLETDDDGHVTGNRDNLEDGLREIISELDAGRRVVVGINRVEDNSTPNSNEALSNEDLDVNYEQDDLATNHFVTVYRIERNDGQVKLHFKDPGTAHEERSSGTLDLNTNTNRMEGDCPYSNNRHYEMTTVRRNVND